MRSITYIILVLILSECNFVQSEKESLTDNTELVITEAIEVIREGDDYIMGEGEYWLVFKTNNNQISKWISENPPWELEEWKRGPVDYNIGFHCSFGDSGGSPSVTTIGEHTYYSNNDVVAKILTDTNNYFSYEERCCPQYGDDPLRFHNGSLLIINPHTKTVYLSIWDF